MDATADTREEEEQQQQQQQEEDSAASPSSPAPASPPPTSTHHPDEEKEEKENDDDDDDDDDVADLDQMVEDVEVSEDDEDVPVQSLLHELASKSDDEVDNRQAKQTQEEGEGEEEEGGPSFSADQQSKPSRRNLEEIRSHVEQANKNRLNLICKKLEPAAEQDREAAAEGRPAVQKLKLLPAFLQVLGFRSPDVMQDALQKGIFRSIAMWLHPLPDDTLPTFQIRSQLYQALLSFTIALTHQTNTQDVEDEFTMEMLQMALGASDEGWFRVGNGDVVTLNDEEIRASCLGRTMMKLWKHPRETKENKRVIGEILQRWARSVLNPRVAPDQPKRTSSSEVARYDTHVLDQLDELALRQAQQKGRALKPGEVGYRRHARIPMPNTMEFNVDFEAIGARTKQQFKTQAGSTERTGGDQLKRKMDNLHRAARKKIIGSSREGFSIEGRGMRD